MPGEHPPQRCPGVGQQLGQRKTVSDLLLPNPSARLGVKPEGLSVTGFGVAPAGPALRAEVPIESALSNRRWLRRSKPFPHVVVTSAFTADTYARLEASF